MVAIVSKNEAAQEVYTKFVLDGGKSNDLCSYFKLERVGANPEKEKKIPISTIEVEEVTALERITEKQGHQVVTQD